MASRKAQKAQARAQREALERRQHAIAQRKRRLQTLAGVLGAAGAIVAVAIAVSAGGGHDKGGLATGTEAARASASVSSLLRGIPQTGNRLGDAIAPVTMQYYGDLQCPVCRSFTLNSLPQVISSYVRPGKLQIEYRSLQTATRDSGTFADQQSAALAAGQQHRLWNFIELFYREQGRENNGYVTNSYLQALARQVPGLDLDRWTRARKSDALRSELSTDAAAASKVGATATPTLIIRGPTAAKALSGDVPYNDIAHAVRAASA